MRLPRDHGNCTMIRKVRESRPDTFERFTFFPTSSTQTLTGQDTNQETGRAMKNFNFKPSSHSYPDRAITISSTDHSPTLQSQPEPRPTAAERKPRSACVQPVPTGLTDSMIHTMVSNDNDALSLLFEAADGDRNQTRSHICQSPGGANKRCATSEDREGLIHPTQVWCMSAYVKMGWLSAEEVVTYVDL